METVRTMELNEGFCRRLAEHVQERRNRVVTAQQVRAVLAADAEAMREQTHVADMGRVPASLALLQHAMTA